MNLIVSVGSNCGHRYENVEKAIKEIENLLEGGLRCSDIYETPCALDKGFPYMNAVISGEYDGSLYEAEKKFKALEIKLGRTQESRLKSEVPIDIDIVVADGVVVKEWDYRQNFFKIGAEMVGII